MKNTYNGHSSRIDQACDTIAQHARTHINHDDVIIIYSFSIPIARTLYSIRRMHSGQIYIIECDQRHRNIYYKEVDENIKIFNYITDCCLNCRFLTLASLGQLMSNLKENKTNVKILLGIHGAVGEEYLCQSGTSILAMVGNAFQENKIQGEGKRVETYVLTESDKLNPFDIDDHIKSLLLQNEEDIYKINTNIKYNSSKIDSIGKQMIDLVITEEGHFDPKRKKTEQHAD